MIRGQKVRVDDEEVLDFGWRVGDIGVVMETPSYPGDFYRIAAVTGDGWEELLVYPKEVTVLDPGV